MLGFYNYTVILTYVGMLSGFAGVAAALDGRISASLICLIIAGVCDMFDGKIAATRERTRQEKRFGVQIDSLSDLICFGALPAVIVYAGTVGRLRLLPCMLYVLSALIRLAWFNVDEEERQDREGGRRRVYYGLPVTSAAAAIPLVMWLCAGLPGAAKWAAPLTLLVMAALFLTPVPIRKPAFRNRMSALLLCAAASVLAAMAGTLL